MNVRSRYQMAHRRVDKAHGLARHNACVWCGLDAQDHAYTHNDPNEIRAGGRVWSENTNYYVAMCRRCHTSFDWAHKQFSGVALQRELERRKREADARVSDEKRKAMAESRARAIEAAETWYAENGWDDGPTCIPSRAAAKAAHERIRRAYEHNAQLRAENREE
ncbi:hypothetical protein GCM10018787_42000 [Streptomyces thermodiastaticus]|nr:hypothetical protein GCM10018787_42000 [Streptomyces thermodiastaticus]